MLKDQMIPDVHTYLLNEALDSRLWEWILGFGVIGLLKVSMKGVGNL